MFKKVISDSNTEKKNTFRIALNNMYYRIQLYIGRRDGFYSRSANEVIKHYKAISPDSLTIKDTLRLLSRIPKFDNRRDYYYCKSYYDSFYSDRFYSVWENIPESHRLNKAVIKLFIHKCCLENIPDFINKLKNAATDDFICNLVINRLTKDLIPYIHDKKKVIDVKGEAPYGGGANGPHDGGVEEKYHFENHYELAAKILNNLPQEVTERVLSKISLEHITKIRFAICKITIGENLYSALKSEGISSIFAQRLDPSGKIVDAWANSDIKNAFHKLFPTLDFLEKRFSGEEFNGSDWYIHTLRLVKSVMVLASATYISDCDNRDYQWFKRLDPQKQSTEDEISYESFKKVTNRFKQIIGYYFEEQNLDKLLFLIALCITHDYGTLISIPKHFIISGKMCREELERLGLEKSMVDLAELIISNHSYMSDFLLGEAPLSYADYVSNLFCKLGYSELGYSLLWVFNVLDINSTVGGFISEEKFSQLWKLNNYAALSDYFGKTKRQQLIHRISFLNKNIDVSLVTNGFADVYMRHFYNLANNPIFMEKINKGTLEKLLSILGDLWKKTRKIDVNGIANYNYIYFQSGEMKGSSDLMQKIILDLICAIKDGQKKNKYIDTKNKTFLGYSYHIDEEYGCLVINNVSSNV